MRVFVVTLTEWYYDSQEVEVVKAFTDLDKAEAYVAEANKKAFRGYYDLHSVVLDD